MIKYKKRIKDFLILAKWVIRKPSYPLNPDKKVLIHLGCGDINSPEFINIDSRYLSHIHHVRDVKDLSIFKDNFADFIYACHVLEHISHKDIDLVLMEWKRVLKPGGKLRISVPDFDMILEIYFETNKSIEEIIGPLMGAQDYKQNFHYSVFNHFFLSNHLKKVHFASIQNWDPSKVENHNFNDWSGVSFEINGKNFPISLNIEAVK